MGVTNGENYTNYTEQHLRWSGGEDVRYSVKLKNGQHVSMGEGEMILYSFGRAVWVIIKAVLWLVWMAGVLVVRGVRKVVRV